VNRTDAERLDELEQLLGSLARATAMLAKVLEEMRDLAHVERPRPALRLVEGDQ
jgi:hypothetical protein